mgnify:CR=1 FL=1
MEKILVTGVTGFIGKALCKRMMLNGWQVLGTVRSLDQATKRPARVGIVQIKSIGADTDWSYALSGVDAVVHLAARVHVMNDTSLYPLSAFRQVNVAGTERLARMAAINVAVRSNLISAYRFYEKKTMRKIEEVRARLKSLVGLIGLILGDG